jgi:hypothetical protein
MDKKPAPGAGQQHYNEMGVGDKPLEIGNPDGPNPVFTTTARNRPGAESAPALTVRATTVGGLGDG